MSLKGYDSTIQGKAKISPSPAPESEKRRLPETQVHCARNQNYLSLIFGATFLLSLFSLSLAPTKITNVSCSQNNYTYLNYGWPLRLQHHSQTLLWWGCFQSHDRQKERSVPFWSHIKLVLWNVYVPWSTAIWKILAKHAGFIACCRHSNGAAAILSCLNFDQLCPSPKNRFTAHSK